MTPLTIGERIILHLSRYDMVDPDDIYNIPWDLTQDGIASSLRISRAHASIELKKLRIADKVLEKQTHIKGGKSKRKSYLLTPLGLNDSKRIKNYAEEEGIDIMPLLDMKRCDPNSLLDSIDDESKEVLGIACVLRCSVKRDTLPDTKQSVIPVDVSGNTILSDDVKKKITSAMDEEELLRLHSIAADYWLSTEEPDRHERLYHLIRSERKRDACRLIINEKDFFMDSLDEDFNGMISELEGIPDKYVTEVLSIKIMSSLEFDDTESARDSIKQLLEYDENAGKIYLADLALASGDPETAVSILSNSAGELDADIRIAKAMADIGRLGEARQMLDGLRFKISSSGSAQHLNDVYLTLSTICIRMGSPEEAIPYLNKAKGSASPRDMKKIFRKMSEVYDAMGIAEEIKRGL